MLWNLALLQKQLKLKDGGREKKGGKRSYLYLKMISREGYHSFFYLIKFHVPLVSSKCYRLGNLQENKARDLYASE